MLEEKKSNRHRMLIWSWFTFWLLNQWHYNSVQKLVVLSYKLSFSLGLWFDFYLVLLKHNVKCEKIHTNPCFILTSNSMVYNFFQIIRHSLSFTI
jgi:hypothetical protein